MVQPGRSGPRRAGAVGAVEDGFDTQGVVAPHGLAAGRAWRRTEPADEIRRRILGEGADAFRASVVQRCVNLGEEGLEFLSLRHAVNDGPMPLLLMLGDGGESVP